MPGELSKEQCSVVEEDLKELQLEYARLWTEAAHLLGELNDATAELAVARDEHETAAFHWSDVNHLLVTAEEQLSRCRERSEPDCSEELARVEQLRVELAEAERLHEESHERFDQAEDRVEMLVRHLEEIRNDIDANGERTVARENRMRNGHCHRFK